MKYIQWNNEVINMFLMENDMHVANGQALPATSNYSSTVLCESVRY